MLKELKAHHRNIIQMSFNGFKAPEIAERLGIAPATVTKILNDPLGKAYINGLTDKLKDSTLDVRKELVSMNKNALKAIRTLLESKKTPASVLLNTAKDVLDRTGFKAPDKLNIDFTYQTKTDDEIDAEIMALENSINKTQQVGSTQEADSTNESEASQATKLPSCEEPFNKEPFNKEPFNKTSSCKDSFNTPNEDSYEPLIDPFSLDKGKNNE